MVQPEIVESCLRDLEQGRIDGILSIIKESFCSSVCVEKTDAHASLSCRFLWTVCIYLKSVESVKPSEEDRIYSAICSCMVYLQNHNFSEISKVTPHFEESIYLIVERLLFLNFYNHSVELSRMFRSHLKLYCSRPLLNSPLKTICHKFYCLLWNKAREHESKRKGCSTGLKLRCEGLYFFFLIHKDVEKFCEKPLFSLIHRYCSLNEPFDVMHFKSLLEWIWPELQSKVQCSESKCSLVFFVKTVCMWSTAFRRVTSDKDMFSLLLSFILSSECSCINSSSVLVTCVKILKFCISMFVLEKHIEVCAGEIDQWKSTLEDPHLQDSEQNIIVYVSKCFTSLFVYYVHIQTKVSEVCAKKTNELGMDFLPILRLCGIVYKGLESLNSKNTEEPSVTITVPENQVMLAAGVMNIYVVALSSQSNELGDDTVSEYIAVGLEYMEKMKDALGRAREKKEILLKSSQICVCFNVIGNFGRLCYQKKLLNEASAFFMAILDNAAWLLETSEGIEKLEKHFHTDFELLISSYMNRKMFTEALRCVARLIVVNDSKTKCWFTWWLKVKKKAFDTCDRTVGKKTIASILREAGIFIEQEKELHLLKQELAACKRDGKHNVGEEIAHICFDFMAKGMMEHADIVLELSQLSVMPSDLEMFGEKSAITMCENTVKFYEEALLVMPSDCFVTKMKLSVALFWLYYHDTKRRRDDAFDEIAKCRDFVEKSSEIEGKYAHGLDTENDLEETGDLKIAYTHLTASTEASRLKVLVRAVDLWKELCESLSSEPSQSLKYCMETFDLLRTIKRAAEALCLACYLPYELKTWCILREFSFHLENHYYELMAAENIVVILTEAGYLSLAEGVIDHTLQYIFPLLTDDGMAEEAKAGFKCAQVTFLVEKGKFLDGWEILQNILKSPLLANAKSLSSPVLEVKVKKLLSHYALIPPKAFPSSLFSKDELVSYNPLALLGECTARCRRYLKSFSSSNLPVGNRDLVLEVTILFLNCSIKVGDLCREVGWPGGAIFYLQECLNTSQQLVLTKWSVRSLISLAYTDLLCENTDGCEVKLNSLKLILKQNDVIKNTETANPPNFSLCENEEDEDQASFLHVCSREMDTDSQIRLDFAEVKNQLHSPHSPVTHERRKAPKLDKSLCLQCCNCQKCAVCSMQLVCLEMSVLHCYYLGLKGVISEAYEGYNSIQSSFKSIMNEEITLGETFLSFASNRDLGKKPARVACGAEQSFIAKILAQMAWLSFIDEKLEDAENFISKAITELDCDSRHLVEIFHPYQFAYIMYVKALIKIRMAENTTNFSEGDSPFWRFWLKSKVISVEEISKGVKAMSVAATPQREVPSVQVKNTELCQAPVKKSLLSSLVKKRDFESASCSTSGGSSASITPFSVVSFGSEDESVFTNESAQSGTPKRPCGSMTALRTKPRGQQSKLGSHSSNNDEKHPFVYKFFKSKIDQNLLSDTESCISVSQLVRSPVTTRSRSKKLKGRNNISSQKKCNTSFQKSKRTAARIHKKCQPVQRIQSSVDLRPDETTGNRIISDELCMLSESHTSDEPFDLERPKRCHRSEASGSFFYDDRNTSETVVKKKENFQSSRNVHCLQYESSASGFDMETVFSELKDAISAIEHFPFYAVYVEMCKLCAILGVLLKLNSTDDTEERTILSSSYLLSESFALTFRHQALMILAKVFPKIGKCTKANHCDKDIEEPVTQELILAKHKALSFQWWEKGYAEFSKRMECLMDFLPENYTVVQICTLSDHSNSSSKKPSVPKLIISRYRKKTLPCVIGVDSASELSFNLMEEFNSIMLENKITMKSAESPKSWWHARFHLDHRIRELLSAIESQWLGAWKCLFLGSPVDAKRTELIDKAVQSISFCKGKEILRVLLDGASYLSEKELSSAVCQLWEISPADNAHSSICTYIRNAVRCFPVVDRHPVVLILDKDLYCLPWESIPILRGAQVTRMSSLRMLNYHLYSCDQHTASCCKAVDSSKTFYVLNPTNDLPSTQQLFEEEFKKCRSWKGCVGHRLTSMEFKEAVGGHELFIYLGHGNGRRFHAGEDVDVRMCEAASVLMGCSSGLLKRPGRYLEAYGDVLKYWFCGSPCVIANLWDVTDRDIDRFTVALLEKWLPEYGGKIQQEASVCKAVNFARSKCLMKYLIGCAPVVHGLPLFTEVVKCDVPECIDNRGIICTDSAL